MSGDSSVGRRRFVERWLLLRIMDHAGGDRFIVVARVSIITLRGSSGVIQLM